MNLAHVMFPPFLIQISDDDTSKEARWEGESASDSS
jgi:hypothetical protein